MSYQEKRQIVSIVTGALLFAVYCVYAFGKISSGAVGSEDLRFFAGTMLLFIGIGIAAMIVIQIVFHILMSVAIAVKERSRSDAEIEKAVGAAFVEDEMDKLIELKSGRVGFVFIGAGFVAGLVTLVLNCAPAVMLNIIYLSAAAGTLAGGAASIYYYRAGIR